jgi:hypothetical protein
MAETGGRTIVRNTSSVVRLRYLYAIRTQIRVESIEYIFKPVGLLCEPGAIGYFISLHFLVLSELDLQVVHEIRKKNNK